MQIELDVFLSSHGLDGFAEHSDQLIERLPLGRHAFSFEHAANVPIILAANGT